MKLKISEGEYVDRGLGISHIYIEYSDGVVTERQYSRNGRNLRYTEENVKNGTIYNNVYYANGDLYMSSELDIDSGKSKMKYTDMDSEEVIERDYSYDDNGEIITSKSSDGRQVSYYELSKNIATFKQYDENGDLWSEIETDYENRTAKYYIFEQDYKARYNEEWHYDENGIRITERYDVSNYDWNEEKEIYYDEPYHSQTFKSNYLTGESSRIYYNSDGSIRSMDNSYYNDDGISISESRSAGGAFYINMSLILRTDLNIHIHICTMKTAVLSVKKHTEKIKTCISHP